MSKMMDILLNNELKNIQPYYSNQTLPIITENFLNVPTGIMMICL